VHQVAKLDNAIAVIADHYWSARQGLEAGAATFEDGPHASISTADVAAALAKAAEKPGAVAKNEGDVAAALAKAASQCEVDEMLLRDVCYHARSGRHDHVSQVSS
jgi:isoquinoline 1-oxidoreductase subunit beta